MTKVFYPTPQDYQELEDEIVTIPHYIYIPSITNKTVNYLTNKEPEIIYIDEKDLCAFCRRKK